MHMSRCWHSRLVIALSAIGVPALKVFG